MAERYCPYCMKGREDKGFKVVFHAGSKTRRVMCQVCQELRKKPRSELELLAQKEKKERNQK
jgi:hypothetical protein